MQKLQKSSKGFTIIEVLIVLAIAGLIMVVVFLAIPALNRNSRNTQRKNDVQAALGSVQEVMNNNNGTLPATVAAGVGEAKFGFYAAGDFTGALNNAAAVASVTPNQTGVIVQNFAKCPATVPVSGNVTTSANATRRSVVMVYQVETSSGWQNQCADF